MWNWLRKLLTPEGLAHGDAAQPTAAAVGLVADGVCVRSADGTERTLRWQDLGSVVIVTNDRGPFDVDLHWVLTSRDGRQNLSVPLGASGEKELLAALQRRLPGFDNDAVIRAMGSTDNATFDVWSWTPVAG